VVVEVLVGAGFWAPRRVKQTARRANQNILGKWRIYMGNRINRYRCEVALAVGVSIAGLNACMAEMGPTDSDPDESAASVQEPIIAGAEVIQVTERAKLWRGGTVAVFVNCPANTQVVGGGYSWEGAGGVGSVRVYSSKIGGNSWWANAINLSNTQDAYVDVFAQCLKGTTANASILQWSPETTIPAGGTATAQVGCPDNILAGGGFVGNSAVQVYQNTPKVVNGTNMWFVAARNLNSSQATTFRAQAICVWGVNGTSTVKNKRVLSVPAGGEVTFNSATCPAETLLGSGGSFFSNGTSNTIRATLRNSTPSLWTTTMTNNDSAANTGQLNTLCLELWPLP